MKRVLLVIAWVAGALAPLALTATPAGATPAAGCPTLNGSAFDGSSTGDSLFPLDFNAGERIMFTAANPASGTPTAVNLRIGGNLVDTATFPGTVSFTAPADLSGIGVSWDLAPAGATATWTVSCSPAPAQSSGCAFLNGPTLDGHYGSGGPTSQFFNAGDRITFHGTPPFDTSTPTGLELRINASATDASPFPGTVSFTFPVSATASVFWGTTPAGNVNWTVTCTPRQASEGCADMQSPTLDTSLQAEGLTQPKHFFAGEQLSISAAAPTTGAPTSITLTVNGSTGNTLNSRAFPGTLQFTFSADTATTLVLWTVGTGNTATWTVDCTPAPVDSTAPTCTGLAPRRAPGTLSNHDEQDVRVQDGGSGTLKVENIVITNGTFLVAQFTAGQRAPFLLTAVKTTQGMPTRWSFDVFDEVGNFRHCT